MELKAGIRMFAGWQSRKEERELPWEDEQWNKNKCQLLDEAFCPDSATGRKTAEREVNTCKTIQNHSQFKC